MGSYFNFKKMLLKGHNDIDYNIMIIKIKNIIKLQKN